MPTRPTFRKINPADLPVLYLQIHSQTLPLSQVDEYAETLVAQSISTVEGVAQVQVYGSQKYAVRVQLDPDQLSARGLGVDQIAAALRSGSVKRPSGNLVGPHTSYTLQTNDQLLNAAAFRPLIVGVSRGLPVRLEQVAQVKDSTENDMVSNWTRYGRSIVLAVQRQPGVNTVQVIDDIKAKLPSLIAQMPGSVGLHILFDRSTTIRASVHHVEVTLIISALLVVGVIFLFLRNLRATLIPSMSLPACLLATFAVMALCSFSLDDMSLMALTLCVGFVVDDAIVVLESIVRHLELGADAQTAAIEGTREVSFTIVSMTLSLIAVFIPILFLGGLIGRIFREFAVTISAAILVSGFVSLTLTPMLCSRFLKPHPSHPGSPLEKIYNACLGLYATSLRVVLAHRLPTLIFSALLAVLTGWMLATCPKGFIPNTDTGQIFGTTEAKQSISFEDMARHQAQVSALVAQEPDVENFMSAIGASRAGGPLTNLNSGRVLLALKPRQERKLGADDLIKKLRAKLGNIPGIRLYMQNPPAIRMGSRSTKGSYQVALQSTDLKALYESVDTMLALLKDTPGVLDATPDVQPSSLSVHIEVDRDKAAQLGLSSQQIDTALNLAYGSSQVTTLYTSENEYQVMLELDPRFTTGPELLAKLYVRSAGGRLVPLNAFTHLKTGVAPLSITHLGQLPSATLSFNLQPGASLGDVVQAIKGASRDRLPKEVTASFQGNAQAFQTALQQMFFLLVVAVLFIYIVLGILYESFAHPLTILTGLPSAGVGALLMLQLFGKDLDVYGFLGLILLLGIVKKNAIMMIDYSLVLERTAAMAPEQAIYQASLVRFRPIMMTTMAAFMGTLPLAIGFGQGSEARQPLGLAVIGGLMASQLLTLYITPVIYIYVDHASKFVRRRFRQ